MGTIIDENDEIDIAAEWADKVVHSSQPLWRRRVGQRKLQMRRRIEDIQERRRLNTLLEGYDPSLVDRVWLTDF